MLTQSARQLLLETVQGDVLPRLKDIDLWQILYVDTPFSFPDSVGVELHAGKPLTAQAADPPFSSDLTHNWASLWLHSSRFPWIGFVIEGSIDYRIGITAQMAKNGGKALIRSSHATLTIPQNTFFLLPPGVPYADLEWPYWDRAVAANKPIKAIWIQFHRFGMQAVLTYTQGETHILCPAVYAASSRTLFAAEAIIEELALGSDASKDIVQTLLTFCLQRVQRSLLASKQIDADAVIPTLAVPGSTVEIVERACLYIESNFDKRVTLQSTAAHVYISSSHLARLFKAEKGMTIIEYLTRFRLEYICSLLAKTDLRINHIGKISGYVNPSCLTQMFTRRMGCSPQQYRDSHQTNAKVR